MTRRSVSVQGTSKAKEGSDANSAGAAFGADYLARFRAMVDELRSDPEIRVLVFQVNPPASERDIVAIEEQIGVPLAPSLRSFYEAADGLQLRWIHARHPQFDATKVPSGEHALSHGEILMGGTREHGLINLLPARETFLEGDWYQTTWFDDMEDYEPVEFKGESVPSLEFHKSLRLFDLYSFYDMAALYVRRGRGDPPVLFGTDHGVDWSDSLEAKKHPSFESYLETVLAHRGLLACRSKIRPRAYWEAHRLTLKKLIAGLELVDPLPDQALRGALADFPLSSQPGHKPEVERAVLLPHIEAMATSHAALTAAALQKLVAKHLAFLESGGAGGSFAKLSVAGLPMCVYDRKGKKGKQLSLAMTLVKPEASLEGANLTHADLSGSICREVVFRKAKLDHSVALDGAFDGADFSGASLKKVDFTGSSLKGCSFKNAKLNDADFENTDCTGADFGGADLSGARFPGAILLDVHRDAPRPARSARGGR